jgi:hypothetical protein
VRSIPIWPSAEWSVPTRRILRDAIVPRIPRSSPDKRRRHSAAVGENDDNQDDQENAQPAAWVDDLRDELCAFPNGRHDDCTDAICYIVNRLRGSGDDLGLISWFRDRAAGWLARTPVLKPKVIVMPKAPAVSCAKCGSSNVEQYGNGSTARTHCLFCGAFNDPVEPFSCPQCGSATNVIASGRRCVQCAFQFWPDGTAPPKRIVATRSRLRRIS